MLVNICIDIGSIYISEFLVAISGHAFEDLHPWINIDIGHFSTRHISSARGGNNRGMHNGALEISTCCMQY